MTAACDWCRADTTDPSSVSDMNGTLKFCSFLCLNKYKMNLFCVETQQHLPRLKSENSKSPQTIDKKTNPTLLITPDLWFPDETTNSKHTDNNSEKTSKYLDPLQADKHITSTTLLPSCTPDPGVKSPFVFMHQGLSSDQSELPKYSRVDKFSSLNVAKKRCRSFNTNESESSDEPSDVQNNINHNHSSVDKAALKKISLNRNNNSKGNNGSRSVFKSDSNDVPSFDPTSSTTHRFPIQNPFDLLSKENFPAHNLPKFPFLLQTPWLSNTPQQIPNWIKNFNPPIAFPNFIANDPNGIPYLKNLPTHSQFPIPPPLMPQPQINNSLIPPSTTMVPYPFIIPVPIPIPIPFPIPEKYLKEKKQKDQNSTADESNVKKVISQKFQPEDSNPNGETTNTCNTTVGPTSNQALDFSMHRSTTAPITNDTPPLVPMFNGESLKMTIKIEPTESVLDPVDVGMQSPLISSNNLLRSRPTYASRRSLILDAPQPPISNSIMPNNYINTKKSPHNHNTRKKCHTVQIKAK